MKHTAKILLTICSLVVGLHIWGALQPSYANWGISLYSFFDSTVLWVGVLGVVVASIPGIQSKLVAFLSRLIQLLSKLPTLVVFLAIVSSVCVIGTLFTAKLHLLGDGALLLRSLSNTVWGDNITTSFNNQPLLYGIFRAALEHHFIDSPLNTYDLYIGINRFATLVFIAVIFWCLAKSRLSGMEKVLVGCILFFNAGTQFFFGYIENYVLQYITTGLFVLSGWFALERRVHIAVPILCFCVNVGFHLGSIVFLPSLLVLILLFFRKNRVRNMIIVGGIGAVGFAAIYYVGYLPALMRHFSSESVDFLRLFEKGSGNFPYPMFSWIHFLDWFNLNMLVAPLGLIAALTLLAVFPKERFRENPAVLFLIAATACGLLFTWVINSALGMVRDWDLLAGFFVPLMLLNAYLLQSLQFERRQYVLAVMAVVLIFHWVPWIGINADENRHLQRVASLNVPELVSRTSQLFYDEALANFFFDRQRYAEAKQYYEHYVTIQSNNVRIIGNISDVYRKLGDKEKYFAMLKKAVSLNSKDPGIYSNLGVEYASRGDTNRAIEFNLRALEIDPRQDKAQANLGILYSSKQEYRKAQQYFDGAINMGMKDPMLFKYAADLNFFLDDYAKAVQYYDVYLSLRPGDQKTRSNRERAFQALRQQQGPP